MCIQTFTPIDNIRISIKILKAPSDKISLSDHYETQLLSLVKSVNSTRITRKISKIKIKIKMKTRSCTNCNPKLQLQLQLQLELYVSENNGLLERLRDGEVVLSKASVSASDSMEVAAVS